MLNFIKGDALSTLARYPSDSFDGMITSPPYWGQVDYDVAGQIGIESSVLDYYERVTVVLREAFRTLKEGASSYVVIGDTVNNYSPVRKKSDKRKHGEWSYRRFLQRGFREKEMMGIPFVLAQRLACSDCFLRRVLVWDKGQSSACPNSDAAPITHEYVLHFVKWTQPLRPYANTSPLKASVLRHPPEKRLSHPAPFPLSLAEELIESFPPTAHILDPFAGSGTTLVAADRLGRSATGIDLSLNHLRPEHVSVQISLSQGRSDDTPAVLLVDDIPCRE